MSRRPFNSVGWKVHGWTYPVVWWARRKPYSNFRQRVWDVRDAYLWRQTLKKWKSGGDPE